MLLVTGEVPQTDVTGVTENNSHHYLGGEKEREKREREKREKGLKSKEGRGREKVGGKGEGGEERMGEVRKKKGEGWRKGSKYGYARPILTYCLEHLASS